jgi:hypothetical protein
MSYANMYDHMMNGLKAWPSPWALEKDAPLADLDVTIYKGRCISLNDDGEFVLGLSGVNALPHIAVRSSDGADVRMSAGNMTGGIMTGLPVTGGFEIETTEFDDEQSYLPNQELTCDEDGLITVGTYYVDTILGIVSDGVTVGPYRQNMLRFWTEFVAVPVALSSL